MNRFLRMVVRHPADVQETIKTIQREIKNDSATFFLGGLWLLSKQEH